jgi:hypothetical protein
MTMTVATLHKRLAELVTRGHGRKPVCINKETFRDSLEQDGCVILGVEAIEGPKWIPNCDDDGGTKKNADGSESGRMTVVLKGDAQ